jgi:uncharacterized protein YjbJ (UPF0337 family)
MSNVDDAAVATYPALVVEEERSFLTRVRGWMCLGLAVCREARREPPEDTIEERGVMDKDKVTGKLKETEGKVTGDKVRETQGESEKDWGKVKDKARDAKEKVT